MSCEPMSPGHMKLCHFETGLARPFFLIAGPCVIESEQLALDTAGRIREISDRLGIPFIYKSSFDKANRSSWKSFRGPGMDEGLRILETVRDQLGVPVLTNDVDWSTGRLEFPYEDRCCACSTRL